MKKSSLKRQVEDIFFEYEDLEKRRHAIQRFFMFFIATIIGFIMTIINWNEKNSNISAITIGITLLGLIGQLLIIKKRIRLAGIALAIFYGAMCFDFAITGGENGFSVLWAFLAPLGAFLIFELKVGVIINIINCCFFFILFWTPLNHFIYPYGDYFLLRYPIVMMAMSLLCFLVERLRYKDIKELKEANKRLEHIAYTDELTGAPNFDKFQMDSTNLLRLNYLGSYVIMVIDIENFKVINDKYGYSYGNEVLISLAEELRQICDENETYARVNADNFVLLLNYQDKNLLDVRILKINERLRNFNHKLVLRFDYGIYIVDNGYLDIMTLYDRALMAMGIKKDNIRVDINYYNEEIRRKLLNERFMEETMESALFNREFLVYFQPKYNLIEDRYGGAEALVRWQKDDGTIIPPSDFISFFEKNGYITKIDMYVLREVCKSMHKWIQEGIKPITVSVNVSKLDFYKESFLDDVIEIVDSYNIPHKYIELEMTETLAAENLQDFIDFSNNCRNAGFLVSMDDFGSGYSSLTILKELPVDIIKLDKSMFSEDIASDEFNKGRIIIENIIDLCKKLNIKVVAEGIESKDLVYMLREMKCDMIQGYFFGKPMITEEFEELLS